VKILVLEGVTERGRALLEAEGFALDVRKALPPSELVPLVGDVDAILVRSGSRITAEVIEAAPRLRVIGRPGVGVDNVDIDAATRRGVVVMNSPLGNLLSTAELTFALLLGTARPTARADASMKAGVWDRKSFSGVELSGKRLGVVGFGRIGREVAARARAFGMDVVAFDPFVSPALAEAHHVRLLPLDELLPVCDFLTLHTTLNKDSRHLIGRPALAKVKPGVRLVNAARGELIDPDALLEALESGRVAAAALDVHAQEPPVDWRLAQHPRVLATPHIGAATAEAQERVGTDIAQQVRDFLKGGVIQQAVNFFALSPDLYERVRLAMDLAERLGSFLAQLGDGPLERLELGLYGELRELDPQPLLSAALTGALRHAMDRQVTVVNALALAQERGIEVLETTSSARVAFANLMAMRVRCAESGASAAATLFGGSHVRLVDLDGVELDAIPRGHLLLVRNDDTPGVVGQVGTLLGQRGINIARMSLGRKPDSGRAVMLIEVEQEAPPGLLAEVAALPGVREARALRLPA
jgi:D-3-phosphoglycerate dehydrogenase